MGTLNPCLCVVFNHPFPDNIPILDAIYRSRFPNIRYLIPFYRDVSNSEIITVYRGSYVHQGFATDAAWRLRDIDCSHYIFLQDDVLLNPSLNADNLLERLGVGATDGFVNQMSSLVIDVGNWHWILGILWKFFFTRNMLSGTGVDSFETLLNYLPPVEKACSIMAKYGIGLPVITRTEHSLTDVGVVHDIPYFGTRNPELIFQMNKVVVDSLYDTASTPNRIEIPYPFVMSGWGADFFIVPKQSFDAYQHYAGVLAAGGTFAEISVATALALTVDNVVTALGKPYRFEWVWTPDREHQAEDLSKKLEDPDMIAVHPVKLSIIRRDPAMFARIFPNLTGC